MHLDNVVGCGWGVKRTGGVKTDQHGLVVFVRRKFPRTALHPRHIVPLYVGDAPTDVVEVGQLRMLVQPMPVMGSSDGPAEGDRSARWRPARPGVSFGHRSVTAGTFGAVVKDRKTGEVYMLSNNHVAANGTDGRDGRAGVGDEVLQPGPYDGGTREHDVIGRLERFVPLHPMFKAPVCPWAQRAERVLNVPLRWFARGYSMQLVKKHPEDNFVDCALVKPEDPATVAKDIIGIGRVRGLAEAEIGMGVKKSGRTSGVTGGEVVALGATLDIGLDESAVARFADQIVTTPLAQPGDSGSLVVDADNRAIGLLFAGSDEATLCNPIAAVCEALDVEF